MSTGRCWRYPDDLVDLAPVPWRDAELAVERARERRQVGISEDRRNPRQRDASVAQELLCHAAADIRQDVLVVEAGRVQASLDTLTPARFEVRLFAEGRRTYRVAVQPYEVAGTREALVFLTDASEAAEKSSDLATAGRVFFGVCDMGISPW